MARVTVEDCVLKVPNRFELVVYAAQRTRQISAGAPLTVERDNNKNPVVALHEIANGSVDIDSLRQAVIKNFRLNVESDFHDDELSEIFAQDTSAQSLGVDLYKDEDFKETIESSSNTMSMGESSDNNTTNPKLDLNNDESIDDLETDL